MLTFESFDLESHSSCVYDYVKITFGSVEEKYCGSSKPSPIVSSGNTMTVVFHSDQSVNRNGFKATWEAVETSGTFFILMFILKYNIQPTNHVDIFYIHIID